MMTDKKEDPISVIEWLGFKSRPNLAAHRTFGGIVGTLASILVLVTVLPAIFATVGLLWNVMLNPSETATFSTGALIAAILGAPFIIWRTIVAAKQAAVQEQGQRGLIDLGVPVEVVPAFLWRVEIADFGDDLEHIRERPRADAPEVGFEL